MKIVKHTIHFNKDKYIKVRKLKLNTDPQEKTTNMILMYTQVIEEVDFEVLDWKDYLK